MRFRPIGDIVVVKPELEQTDTWLMDHHRRKGSAEVIRIGNQVNDVVPGDRAYFNPFAGVEMNLDGEVFLLLHAAELFALEARRPSLSDRPES